MPKLLVANRGEIAIRILRSASELGWITVAVYTEDDISHATFADEAVKLESAAGYLNIDAIVQAALRTQCTHLHPGYGFLSENPLLPLALDTRVVYIGPSPSTLEIASDKMASRELAESLEIPIAPGIRVMSALDVEAFAKGVGYPLMIKALDGGGGRGIRVVSDERNIKEAFDRCLGESPSKQLFVEKALIGPGWKHVEVQVIGDGQEVNHLWERECSVQRRFQKIMEIAPSHLPRDRVKPLLDASLKMAKKLQYKGLGTFEFLVNAHSSHQWVFLEINPRVQVEHTITEEIINIDLVRTQLLLFSSESPSKHVTLSSLSLYLPPPPPASYAIQLRLTAEDPEKGFQLSPGTLRACDIVWPGGRGVRVDTWLTSATDQDHQEVSWTIGTEFDSLLSKIIVRGNSFEEATQKGIRALKEVQLGGVSRPKIKTNLRVLLGTLGHPDWRQNSESGIIDTLWLEQNIEEVISLGNKLQTEVGRPKKELTMLSDPNVNGRLKLDNGLGRSNILLHPGSLFHLTLSQPSTQTAGTDSPSSPTEPTSTTRHTLTLTSVGQNAFPEALSGTLISTFLGARAPVAFTLTQSTSVANLPSGSGGQFELADPSDPMHVGMPITGKVVELHVSLKQAQGTDKKDLQAPKIRVRKGDPLVVVSVMKMENVVASPCDGYVARVGAGIRVGTVLGEGTLICVLQNERSETRRSRL